MDYAVKQVPGQSAHGTRYCLAVKFEGSKICYIHSRVHDEQNLMEGQCLISFGSGNSSEKTNQSVNDRIRSTEKMLAHVQRSH